ncbi:MAG TPA: hypothetical protein VGS06_18385 [Streptosporangiaceae bacterium]|nr:hypothetical protein [Streptosporangiaceae bacterium]
MAHRVAKGLVGGCALLLGVTVTGCGAPQYTYVANSSQSTYFKVPHGWNQISGSALQKVEAQVQYPAGAWQVAYEAGGSPTASDFLGFGADHPFVFAEIGTLTPAGSQDLSYNVLRDIFLPVTSTARQNEPAGYPLTGFKQIRDQNLMPGLGVHGVRETFEYTLNGGPTDTFDEIALTNAEDTVVYFMVLHCTTSCYSSDQTQINDVMSSFTIRSSS